MADSDDPAAAAARLEAALERIARLCRARSAGPAALAPAESASQARPEISAEVAARLDALILQLRKLLPRSDD